MVEVASQLLGDTDEIKLNLLPNLIEFVALFPPDNQRVLLNSMIRERLVSGKDLVLLLINDFCWV